MRYSYFRIALLLLSAFLLSNCSDDDQGVNRANLQVFQGTQTQTFSGQTSDFTLLFNDPDAQVISGRVTSPIDPAQLISFQDARRDADKIVFSAHARYSWSYEVLISGNTVTGLFRTGDITDHDGIFRATRTE